MPYGQPINQAIRFASSAATAVSLLASNVSVGYPQGAGTFDVFIVSAVSGVFSALIYDGTNTQQVDFNGGTALTASAGYWFSLPALGSAYSYNFKFPAVTGTTAYSLIVDWRGTDAR